MHYSRIFKSVALVALLLLVASPALAAHGHEILPEDMSQSDKTMREITHTSAITATHTTLDLILDRNATLYGFDGNTAETGASGGNGDVGVGIWASHGWMYMDRSGTQWSRGYMTTVTGGIDKKFGNAVIGVAVGGEWLRLNMSDSGRYRYDGFSLTSYFSYALMPTLVMDTAVGFGWQNNRQRTSYISWIDNQSHSMEKDYDSWRLFTAAGLSKYWSIDNWVISARLGAMYLHQDTPSYTMTGIDVLPFSNDTVDISRNRHDLFQLSLGGRVGYRFGNFNPFVGATYLQDVAKSGKQNDFSGADFQAGFNYRVGNVSLGLTGTYGIRYAFQKFGCMANIRLDF